MFYICRDCVFTCRGRFVKNTLSPRGSIRNMKECKALKLDVYGNSVNRAKFCYYLMLHVVRIYIEITLYP